jgi:hypothetical protein
MRVFEYRVERVKADRAEQLLNHHTADGKHRPPELERALNALGREGWELMSCNCTTHEAVLVLKRLIDGAV